MQDTNWFTATVRCLGARLIQIESRTVVRLAFPTVDRIVTKTKRRQLILDLIQAQSLSSQQDVVDALVACGVVTTQATVSRDLEECGVVKYQGRYVVPAPVPTPVTAGGLLSLVPAGDALVVARSLPGMASAIALAIDRAGWPFVVGTVAGDDTIFIAVSGPDAQSLVMDACWDLMGRPHARR